MRRLAHVLILAAFAFSCSGNWYALQAVAWVKMVHDYSQVVPLAEAVSMTLSGNYPCAICKAIAEKQQSDNTTMLAAEKSQKLFFPPVAASPIRPAVSTFRYLDSFATFPLRTEAPPTPPPRPLLS